MAVGVGVSVIGAGHDGDAISHRMGDSPRACPRDRRYDGFVAKFMGDGILAYFGFPRAHEEDAARAVHAGLEIADVVAGLETRAREKLLVRIGVATGSEAGQ